MNYRLPSRGGYDDMRPLRQLLTLGNHVHASHYHTLSQVDGFSNRRKGVTYLEKLGIYIFWQASLQDFISQNI